jgi:hypothetical protein
MGANSLLIVFGGLVLFLILFAVALGLWHPRSGIDIVGRSLRSEAAEAEIEESDIDQMIDAQNELRRARGAPEIGDELAYRVRRPGPSDEE